MSNDKPFTIGRAVPTSGVAEAGYEMLFGEKMKEYFKHRSKQQRLEKAVVEAAIANSLAGREFNVQSDKVLDEMKGMNRDNFEDVLDGYRKLDILVSKYGEEMRKTGEALNTAVDILLEFRKAHNEY
jgi:hypothetical protein